MSKRYLFKKRSQKWKIVIICLIVTKNMNTENCFQSLAEAWIGKSYLLKWIHSFECGTIWNYNPNTRVLLTHVRWKSSRFREKNLRVLTHVPLSYTVFQKGVGVAVRPFAFVCVCKKRFNIYFEVKSNNSNNFDERNLIYSFYVLLWNISIFNIISSKVCLQSWARKE